MADAGRNSAPSPSREQPSDPGGAPCPTRRPLLRPTRMTRRAVARSTARLDDVEAHRMEHGPAMTSRRTVTSTSPRSGTSISPRGDGTRAGSGGRPGGPSSRAIAITPAGRAPAPTGILLGVVGSKEACAVARDGLGRTTRAAYGVRSKTRDSAPYLPVLRQPRGGRRTLLLPVRIRARRGARRVSGGR